MTSISIKTAAVAVAILAGSARAAPQGTAFTYQGRLTDGGNPPTGTYDLQFRLFDALSGGVQVGSTIQLDNVAVTNGLFTVQLDFGATPFGDNQARWLDLGVHPGALPVGNPYTILTPRQPLTSAPYSLSTRGINVLGNGLVGVGTSTPTAEFEVQASTCAIPPCSVPDLLRLQRNSLLGGGFSALVLNSTGINTEGSSSDPDLSLNSASAGDVLLANGGGNVGIGTSSPAVPLHVEGGSDSSLGAGGFLVTGGLTSTNISIDNNEIMARNNGAAATLFLNHEGGQVHIGQGSGGSATGRLVTPVLEITGGSDLSEGFDIGGEQVEPGMVVVIDDERPGQLVTASAAYDRKVAGVISGAGGVRTGMMMGQKDSLASGKHPVALTGRVYVWVDASHGAIEPGDLLTTSDTTGHAMKVIDHGRAAGAIIGKAMTSLAEGKGLVLVLVNLQ